MRVTRLFLAGVGLSAILCLTGCGLDHAENKGTDNAYLRMPGEFGDQLQMESGKLLPPDAKGTWEWNVTTQKRESAKEPVAVTRETMTITGSGAGETSDIVLRTTRKPGGESEERFSESSSGLFLSQTMLQETVQILNPIPLVTYPIVEGKGIAWDGVVKFPSGSVPGTAYSRVSGRDIIKIQEKEYTAWRVDTLLRTTQNGQPFGMLVTRWFVPNKGLVRERQYTKELLVEKRLGGIMVPRRY